jgi:hypothetical protein
MQIKTTIRGIEEFQAFLKRTVPRGAIKVALAAIADYLVGTPNKALRREPAYKYVSRARAGYKPMSDRMRRWFWANGGPDMIGAHKRGATQAGWYAKSTKGGYGYTVGNTAPGAYYTMSDKGQAAQPRAVGWRTIAERIGDLMDGAMRHARAMVGAFLAKR